MDRKCTDIPAVVFRAFVSDILHGMSLDFSCEKRRSFTWENIVNFFLGNSQVTCLAPCLGWLRCVLISTSLVEKNSV